VRNAATNLSRWSAIGLGFFIPVSVVLDNILLLLCLMGWLIGGNLSAKLRDIRRHPVAIAILTFAAVMALGMAWSMQPISGQKESMVEILRFVLLGVLLTIFSDERTRARATAAFLASSAVILALSYLLWSGLVPVLPGIKGSSSYPIVFKYHITHSVLMAVAAVLFLLRATEARGNTRSVYAAMTLAAAVNIFFMIPGRTGQLAFAAVLLYVAFSRMKWLGMAAAGAGLAGIVASAWLLPNSVLYQRAERALTEASAWQPDQAQPESSSIGLRLEFYRNTLGMIVERPLVGSGTGSFSKAYRAHIANTTMVPADHPHNAFLLVAAELGLVGLVVLLGLLWVQWQTAARLPSPTQIVAARGLLIVFVISGMVSSTFNDHAEGLFFVWASALLWSGLPTRTSK